MRKKNPQFGGVERYIKWSWCRALLLPRRTVLRNNQVALLRVRLLVQLVTLSTIFDAVRIQFSDKKTGSLFICPKDSAEAMHTVCMQIEMANAKCKQIVIQEIVQVIESLYVHYVVADILIQTPIPMHKLPH